MVERQDPMSHAYGYRALFMPRRVVRKHLVDEAPGLVRGVLRMPADYPTTRTDEYGPRVPR